MTRLKEDWISTMAAEMDAAESTLKNRTGMSYRQLAARAAEMTDQEFDEKTDGLTVGVVTFTTGLGEIGSFAQSVQGIIHKIGIPVFITESTDVNGIFEAHEKGADVVFMADDDRFVALNLKKNRLGENNLATAKGFVVALEGIVGKTKGLSASLFGEEILVIGGGVVGRLMVDEVKRRGGTPVCWDKDPRVLDSLKEKDIKTIQSALDIKKYKYILDASSSGNWMDIGMLHPDSLYVSPGVPLSLTKEAERAKENQMVHDLLQIGVAAMLALAL